MKARELIDILRNLDPDAPVVYPGEGGDLDIEVVGQIDGRLILSNEAEYSGNASPSPAEVPADLREELDSALTRGAGLLILVHESYALLAASRPVHWMLSGTVGEASDWIRRQGTLLKLIEQSGASPAPRRPDVSSNLKSIVGEDL